MFPLSGIAIRLALVCLCVETSFIIFLLYCEQLLCIGTSYSCLNLPGSSTFTFMSMRGRASKDPLPEITAFIPTASPSARGSSTVADAGSAGWRDFANFKQRIIDRSRTRVPAFINIVGQGMRTLNLEQDHADVQVRPTAEMALRHKGLIIGVKTAHYTGPDWTPVERAVEAGTILMQALMICATR
jgi:hypothetical protein